MLLVNVLDQIEIHFVLGFDIAANVLGLVNVDFSFE